MAGRGYTRETVLHAIQGSAGIVTKVAERLGCAWCTARKHIDRWAETRQALEDEGNHVLDLGEAALIAQVQKGEPWAVKFLLSTKGKIRGYTERQEITGADGESLRGLFVAPRRFDTEADWQKHVDEGRHEDPGGDGGE